MDKIKVLSQKKDFQPNVTKKKICMLKNLRKDASFVMPYLCAWTVMAVLYHFHSQVMPSVEDKYWNIAMVSLILAIYKSE